MPRRRFPWLPGAITAGVAAGLLLLAAVGGIWLLGRIASTLKVLAVALLLAVALGPAIDRLERRRVPRLLALGLLLLVLAAVLVAAGIMLVPPVVSQTTGFLQSIPDYWEALRDRAISLLRSVPDLGRRLEQVDLVGVLSGHTNTALSAAGSAAGYLAGFLGAVVMVTLATLFMLTNPRPLLRGMLRALPPAYHALASDIAGQIALKLRAWVRGMVILSLVVGVVVGVGLHFLGVPFAVLFALLAAVLEMVPTLGPILSALPPILVALTISPLTALWVALLFVAVQQLESAILAPLVMSKQLDMHPLVALVALLVMTSLMGVFGAIIALPLMATLGVLYERLYLPLVGAEPVPKEEKPKPEETQAG